MPPVELTECSYAEALVHEVLDGEPAATAALEAHVRECLTCRGTLAAYRRVRRLLRALRAEQVQLPPGLLSDVFAALGDAAERQVLAVRPNRRARTFGTLVLASILVGTLVSVARLRGRPR